MTISIIRNIFPLIYNYVVISLQKIPKSIILSVSDPQRNIVNYYQSDF